MQDRGLQGLASVYYAVDIAEHAVVSAVRADIQECPPGTIQRSEEGRSATSHGDTEDLSVDAVDCIYVSVVDDKVKINERGTTVKRRRVARFLGTRTEV